MLFGYVMFLNLLICVFVCLLMEEMVGYVKVVVVMVVCDWLSMVYFDVVYGEVNLIMCCQVGSYFLLYCSVIGWVCLVVMLEDEWEFIFGYICKCYLEDWLEVCKGLEWVFCDYVDYGFCLLFGEW